MDGAIIVPLLQETTEEGEGGSNVNQQNDAEQEALVTPTPPVIRSRSRSSEGVALGLSEATAETSAPEGPRPRGPTLHRHIPSLLPTRTGGRGPAPAPRRRPRSPRLLSHPSQPW